jgi:hypothetical protein
MKLLEVALAICGALWCASAVFIIYAIGISLLTLTIQTFITAALLMAVATGAEVLLAVLND